MERALKVGLRGAMNSFVGSLAFTRNSNFFTGTNGHLQGVRIVPGTLYKLTHNKPEFIIYLRPLSEV